MGELSPVSAVLCSYVTDGWDPLNYGPPLSVTVGALDQVHLAAKLDLKFDFLYLLFQILLQIQKFISRARSVQIE